MEVGLGPGHIVLDENTAPPPPKKRGAQQPPLFGSRLLWPNGRPSQLLLSSCFLCENGFIPLTRLQFLATFYINIGAVCLV